MASPVGPLPRQQPHVEDAAAGEASAAGNVADGGLASHPIDGSSEQPAAAAEAAVAPHGGSSAAAAAASAFTRLKPGKAALLDSSSPPSSIGAPSSSSYGGGKAARRGSGAPTEGHVRRLTQNLVEILESLSGAAQQQPAHGDRHREALPGVASRGDSCATMADLEAGRGSRFGAGLGANPASAGSSLSLSAAAGGSQGPGSSSSAPASEAGSGSTAAAVPGVPVQHVRRLTTTLVDILRHVASSGGGGGQQDEEQGEQGGRDSEIQPLRERPNSSLLSLRGGGDGSSMPGALPDGASSEFDDRLSLSSAGTATTASGASDSAATALLRAAFLKDEYRGDDVKPFFCSEPLVSAASRKVEELEEAVGADSAPHAPAVDEGAIPHRLQKRRAVNPWGLFVFLFFLAAFGFYIWARASFTLGLGPMLWYGALVLAVEILGGLAMLPYGLCLTMRVTSNTLPPPDEKGQVRTALPYHLRVIIPCYKEPLDVIQKTVTAALVAPIPVNCSRTVYLLDDGRDVDKKKFIHGLGVSNAVYVSGRKRAKGEMNGKSANINNAARQIYPEGHAIPLTEVLCVFDADQVPNADFFLKMVPLLDGGQDVGMVLSPQTFYNLNPGGDIFNHANVHFWDYTQPGYDALGLISCTGTNFLVRARAFHQAGWFPEWTLTEDFALGIELKKLDWQCRYVSEYLAIGEAPEEVRNCFQQRSRWAKGHFQTFFSSHNPIFAKGLSPLMRWMYGSVILSYFSAFTSTPLLMLVPMITVWLGSFPIVINQWAAISITVYYAATLLLMYYTRALAHLKSMWFSSVANSILWFAFLKAMYRATLGRWIDGRITFKVTAKGLQRIADLPIRDVWMSFLFFTTSLVCLIFGLVHFFRGPLDTPLAISLIFMIYNLVPQFLLLFYAAYHKPLVFNAVCKLAMLLSTLVLVLGVVLVWLLYPRSYNYQQALGDTMFFFDSQRQGQLPLSNQVAWRGNAFMGDYNTTVTIASSLPNDTLLGFGMSPDPLAGQFGDFFGRRLFQAADPFAGSDPFAGLAGPAAPAAAGGRVPVAGPASPAAASAGDPFGLGGGSGAGDPFGSSAADPFAASSGADGGNYSGPVDVGGWDLGGGWWSGMSGGNLKATSPIAFTTTLLVWSLMAFGKGFQAAGQAGAALDTIRWGSDYLLKVHKTVPEANQSLLVTRVGDIDTEMLLWYRPEDQPLAQPAYAVDLTTGGSDLGGSVAAALAASSIAFRAQNQSEYAQTLLDKAIEVYNFSTSVKGLFSAGDFNLTLLYNTSTYHDDLAWAAGWLYKATKQEAYLSDVYEHYMNHLSDEAPISDFKFAYDWDNVFWPLNLLLAQETDRSTFRDQAALFLKNWICAGNAANYTARGRAYNPMSGSLGATTNAATMSLMYADLVAPSQPTLAREYRCWALSQVRYVLGDAGRSLVVGHGRNPPKRTQDRAAACPEPPEVCNRVTGLLSPDPDTHVLRGALVYGSGRYDDFSDDRKSDSARVGVENNAGLAAALAGVVELDPGLWEVCLQDYGIYRSSSICGTYLTV